MGCLIVTSKESECLGSTIPPLFKTAAIAGLQAVVAHHLQRGVDVNAIDDKGRSALILAAEKGHTEICQMLLEAGADPASRDHEGNDALSIAAIHCRKDTEELLRKYLPHPLPEPVQEPAPCSDASALTHGGQPPTQTSPEITTETGKTLIEGDDFDLSLWEEEEEAPKPPGDASCLSDAIEMQRQISRHVPLDTDEDWSDIDIDLPEILKFRRRVACSEDSDWLPAIRHLLLSGLRYGWVTERQLIEAVPACEKDLDSPDVEYLTAIRVVMEDLGIQVEDLPDNFSTPLQEAKEEYDTTEIEINDDFNDLLVDEAMIFFFDLLSFNNDPLTLYTRDIGPKKTLSKDEGIDLAREITEGFRDALGAIPRSSAAMNELLEQLRKAEQGELPIRSIINASCKIDEYVLDQEDSHFGDEDDSNDVAHGTLDTPLAPEITAELHLELESIRMIHDALTDAQSRSEQDILADRLKDALQRLGASNELISHLWSKVRSDVSCDHAQEILARGISRARAAKKVFATSHLRLVLWLARKFHGLPFMDLVQEGNIGVLKAIDRFDSSYGAKFSTYATWWIRQSIMRSIDEKQRVIRLPVHILEDLRKLDVASASLTSRLGRNPDINELSLDTDIPEVRVQNILNVINGPLHTIAIEDQEYSFEENVEDLDTQNPEDIVTQIQLKEAIKAAVRSLSAREADIIRLRFGLDDDNDYSLEEIGKMYGVSRERIRQIEMKALGRLAHPIRSEKLRTFLEDTGRTRGTEQ